MKNEKQDELLPINYDQWYITGSQQKSPGWKSHHQSPKKCKSTYLCKFIFIHTMRRNLRKGPFIYYVSTCRGGGGGQKMPIFAYS